MQHHNVNELNIVAVGLGSSYPVANNSTPTGRLQNRRTTIRTSDLVISQIFYRKGLEYIHAESLQQAYFQFSRWLRMAARAQKVEMLTDVRLTRLRYTPYWKLLVAAVQESYSVYPEPKNAMFLDSMYFEDQRCRNRFPIYLGGIIEEIDTVFPLEFKITDEDCVRKDSTNFIAVEKYLDRYGYPEISKVGRRPARDLGYVFIHHPDSFALIKYLPVIKDICMKGEGEWDLFALMTDKLHCIKNELQEYGTQYTIGPHGEFALYKIDNIEAVNKRRVRIGMSPTGNIEY